MGWIVFLSFLLGDPLVFLISICLYAWVERGRRD